MSQQVGTELTRLVDRMRQVADTDLRRRLREQLLGSMGNTVDKVIEEFMSTVTIEIDPETLNLQIKWK